MNIAVGSYTNTRVFFFYARATIPGYPGILLLVWLRILLVNGTKPEPNFGKKNSKGPNEKQVFHYSNI